MNERQTDFDPSEKPGRPRRLFTLQNVSVAGFFLLLLVVGLAVYRDYGLTWDDLAQVEIGRVNYQYAFQGDPALFALKNRYYGPLFEMFLYAVTRGMADRPLFLTRHLLTFASFYIGMIFFYFLAKRITRSRMAGLAACLILTATPPIFAHSFYNSKDIPFLAGFIIAAYTLIRLLDAPSFRNALFHALASAALIALRAPGILIFALTAALLAFYWIIQPGSKNRRSWFFILLVYTAACAGLVILFWPVLWHDPLGEFVNAMQQMSKFPWDGGVVLYRGQFVNANALPWHYIPVWMLITIPLPFLALAGLGGGVGAFHFLFHGGKTLTADRRNFLILAGWFFLPLFAVIVLRAVLYDGWRQMFFIYPPVVIFASLGLKSLAAVRIRRVPARWIQAAAAVLLAGILVNPLIFMLRYHPFENVYFNRLGGADMARVKRHYELDYWGLSYKQGLEYLLKADPSPSIRVYVFNRPGRINALILPQKERDRLVYADQPEQADYFLTNFRYHPQPYEYTDEFYSIQIGNASILSIYRLTPEPKTP